MKSETLKRADEIINGERQDMYGSPEDSFTLIAEYWTAYVDAECRKWNWYELPFKFDSRDVAVMMSLFKIARISGQKVCPDNAVDACGYLAILNDKLKMEQE